ncbi:MATE family efflux transporter [Bradyrhizobium pachyrhizi]|uniref:MATE family efflux transporter n=1 Tax=Bradyrhizobium pachyrhizi TaxID=280333 RepID=UPI0009E5AB6D|nr:MATE family efflux transporter [Bradyrhizobium pachyrhizi]
MTTDVLDRDAPLLEVPVGNAALPASTGAKLNSSSHNRAKDSRDAVLYGPVLVTLLRLALPTVTVLVAQTAVNIAEGYYVGSLGTDALAGAALVFPVFMLMIMMSNGGLGSGVASTVARAIGAGRLEDADDALFHAVLLAIFVGALFTGSLFVGGPALYRMLGGRGPALDAAVTYSNYLFAASIPVWIVNLQSAALRAAGNVKVPALVTLIGAIVTIPLSPVFIFGLFSLPPLGIAGAGLAFGLYYAAATLFLLAYMLSGRAGMSFRVVRPRGGLILDMLKVGIPTALNALLANLTVICITGAVGLFGTHALAGYGIAARLDYIMIPLLFGISTATLTMVGINMGAGQTIRARRIGWTGGVVGSFLTGTIGLAVATFPTMWLNLFSSDPIVVSEGTTYLRIVAPAYCALGLGFVISFAAQGTGRAIRPLVASIAKTGIGAGGSWIAVAYLNAGMTVLATMVAISIVVSAAICVSLMLSRAIWRPPAR